MGDPALVVIDYGSRNFRAGYAHSFPSEEEPRLVSPSAVDVGPATAAQQRHDPASSRSIVHPVVKGQIESMEHLETLIHHALYQHLGWTLGHEGCMLLCEPLLTSKAEREALTQLLFEVFNVAGLFMQDHAVLSLAAFGKTSGSVVDIGYQKVDVSTVVDGQLCSSSVRRLPFGGEELTGLMERVMHERGTPLPGWRRQAEALKHLCMQAADSAEEFDLATGRAVEDGGGAGPSSGNGGERRPWEPQVYRLPDGQEVTIGCEGLHVAEALFRPELLGGPTAADGPSPGLTEALMDSVATQYEGNFQRPALESVLVCGGGGAAANVPQRLISEARALALPGTTPALCTAPEYLPKHAVQHAAWIGGAVMAKVVYTHTQYVTKWDYEEAGPSVTYRKCM